MRPVILIDIDDTILDNTKIIQKYLYGITGIENYDLSTLKDYEFKNLDKEHSKRLLELFDTDGMYNYCDAYPNAVDEVNKIKEFADVVFVTASNVSHADKRLEQLRKIFPDIKKSDIIHTNKKHLIAGDVIIDDSSKNIFNSICPFKFLKTMSWNEGIDTDKYTNMYRINNWLGVAEKVYGLVSITKKC